jgi:pyruvate/2-oxoacid:ferredoxin oxidoreductase beta subunit
MAVQTNLFPLYEVADGTKYTLNYQGDRPVGEYLKGQGRFKQLTDEDIERIQELVNEDWQLLLQKAGLSASLSELEAAASR